MTEKWSDMGYEGKKLRQKFKWMDTRTENLMKKKRPDDDKIMKYAKTMANIVRTQSRLVPVVVLSKEVSELKSIVMALPPEMLALVRQKLGK